MVKILKYHPKVCIGDAVLSCTVDQWMNEDDLRSLIESESQQHGIDHVFTKYDIAVHNQQNQEPRDIVTRWLKEK